MSRNVSGFLGNYDSIAQLTIVNTPAEYAGCSANVGTSAPYTKAWCDGEKWYGFTGDEVLELQNSSSIYDTPEKYGAVGDGVTDDTVALQAAANALKTVLFAAKTYRITSEVVFSTGTRFIGVGNWSAITSLESTNNTTRILYDGAGGTNSCIFRISASPVGTQPPAVAASQRQNITCSNIVLDGNDKAEFGLYMVRAWSNNTLDYITVTGTTKHAFYAATCFNGSPTNWMAYKNKGCGITLGRDLFGWTSGVFAVDQSVCTSFFSYYSGHNVSTVPQNQFNEISNQQAEYGIGVYGGRSLVFINAQANNCGGAGILTNTNLAPVMFIGGYVEGNGVSSGSTKEWAIFFIGNSTGGSHHVEFDGMHLGLTPAIRMLGIVPSRKEASVKFKNMPFLNEIDADWNNYQVINSDRNVTFTNVAPSAFVTRHNNSLNLMPIGIACFDATSGAIVVLNQEGVISNITYDATGTYTVLFSETFSSARWVAQVTGGDNRVVGLSNYTTNSFTIFNRDIAGTLTNTNSTRIMVTVWGYYT